MPVPNNPGYPQCDHGGARWALGQCLLCGASTETPGYQEKVAHVLSAGQTRNHTCHWPGCKRQVPPAMWGCKPHWFKLPKYLRDEIWIQYRVGQEMDMTPTQGYLEAAYEVQSWIHDHYPDEAVDG